MMILPPGEDERRPQNAAAADMTQNNFVTAGCRRARTNGGRRMPLQET